MRTKGSVVVITGAASGIGRATALRFARKGADLVLASRRAEALESLVEECQEHGARVVAVPTDVTDAEEVEALAREAVERFGRIDVWVNNAAVTFFSPFLDVPLEDFRRVLDVNVMGYVHGARAALRRMRQQGSGILINVSSVVAEVPQPYTSAYSMSKAAIRALGVSLRSELTLDKLSGIHVCTVLPPSVDTPFFFHAANYTGREIQAMSPVYSPHRMARAIVNLARAPRREITVGQTGRTMLLQHKFAPAAVERMMASQVDKSHLSTVRPAADTSGNLHTPSSKQRDAQVTGRWGGRTKTGLRRGLTAGALVGAGVVAGRRLAP